VLFNREDQTFEPVLKGCFKATTKKQNPKRRRKKALQEILNLEQASSQL